MEKICDAICSLFKWLITLGGIAIILIILMLGIILGICVA